MVLGVSLLGKNFFFLCFAEERNLEPGSPLFPQIVQHFNKDIFPSPPIFSSEYACVWQQAAEPHFCLVTVPHCYGYYIFIVTSYMTYVIYKELKDDFKNHNHI